MKRILLAGAAVLALTAAQPTLAADAPAYKGPAPYAAALFNWSGFYVGISGGGISGTTRWSVPGVITTPSVTSSAGIVGGTVGANWQTGAWLWGIEGDLSWTGYKVTIPACGGPCTTELNWLGTIRGRGGFVTGSSGMLLIYATGGFAVGGVKNSVVIETNNVTATGWTIGGGTELALTPNFTIKAEYLYVDLGSTLACTAATCALQNNDDFIRSHVFRGGLNWKF